MEKLKILREEAKISQYDLANILEVAQNTVSQWERGVRRPDFGMLEKISDYFNVTVDWLIGKSDIRTYQEYFYHKDLEHFQDIYNDSSISDDAKNNISKSLDCLYLLCIRCIRDEKNNDIDLLVKIRLIIENILKIGDFQISIGEHTTIKYLKELNKIKQEINECLDYINDFQEKKKRDFTDLLNL